MTMAIYHLQTNIEGLLRSQTVKWLGQFFDMDGNEVKRELQALQAKGHKLLPSEGCKHFDPFEHGCQCRLYDSDGNKIDTFKTK